MQKTFFLYTLALLLLFCSCGNNSENAEQMASLNNYTIEKVDYDSMMFKDEFERESARRSKVFKWILDTASNRDTATLIQKLHDFYKLSDGGKGSIESIRSQRIYGAKDSVHVIEYIFANDSICENHPYRQQFLFDPYGRLLYEDKAQAFRFIEIWEEKPPVLMTLETTCEGNGKHHFYKYENGQLIDIYNVLFEYVPQTYDSKADKTIFKPVELIFSVEDVNADGLNDIVFSGQQLWLENAEGRRYSPRRPWAQRELFYAFIFDPSKDQFLEVADYKEQDKLLTKIPNE